MALHCSSWSDLPQEILELIFDYAKDPIDILRCGAACKSWLPTALQVFPNFLRQCFIPTGSGLDITRSLLNPLTREIRMIKVPKAKEKWVCSVSNSWLYTVDTKRPYSMQLLNVLSGTQIDLPPIIKSSTYDVLREDIFPLYFNSDCTFFLLKHSIGGPSTISSWNPGQKEWSNLKTEFEEIHDTILYKEKLYAAVVDSTTLSHLLVTCNYQLEVEAKFSIPQIEKFSGSHYYLLKSHNIGCLLLIGYHRYDKSFNILEFDPCTKQFREVNDFGGFAFFLIRGGHLVAKAENLETWFKANRIYLFSDMEIAYTEYDLETRSLYYVI